MAKVKISEYSVTNSDNTDINSINISEGCAPSGINNAIREVMVHLKNWQTNASGDGATFASLVVQGTGSFTGAVTMSAGSTLSGTNTLSGANIISGNINSSGTTNTFSGGNILSGTNTLSGATVMAASLGTSASPSIYFTSDTNTGIFSPTADTVGVATGGSERLRVDSSGNVGIGVTPSAWLSSGYRVIDIQGNNSVVGYTNGIGQMYLITNSYVNGSSNFTAKATGVGYYLKIDTVNDGGFSFARAPSVSANATQTFSTLMTLDSSGNVGIGTSSPSVRLGVSGAIGLDGTASAVPSNGGIARLSNGFTYVSGKSNDSGTVFSNGDGTATVKAQSPGGSTGYLVFETGAGSERARITSAGEFLVGTTDTSQGSGVGVKVLPAGRVFAVNASSTNSSDGFSLYSTGASAYRFYVGLGGTISATSTTITAISDQRLKENIRDLDDGLDAVMALKPRKFDWKEGKGANIKNARGFIAQEFETVFPDMIEEWRDPAPEGEEPYKAVNANLIPTLVKAIQELKGIVDAQKAELDTVKAELNTLKGQ